jgi:hypothetical protein
MMHLLEKEITVCWDQVAEGYLILNTEKCEGIDHSMGDNKCIGSLMGESPRDLFIGVVKGFGNNA